jgi:hypothetical protein
MERGILIRFDKWHQENNVKELSILVKLLGYFKK